MRLIIEKTRAGKEGVSLPNQIEILRKYLSDDFEKTMRKPEYFVTFTEINKVGINPKSKFTVTPNGIYVYPLTELLLRQMEEGDVPYASDAKFVSLLKRKEGVKVLGIDDFSLLRTLNEIYSQQFLQKLQLGPEFVEDVEGVIEIAEELSKEGDKYAVWTAISEIYDHKSSKFYNTALKKRKRKTDMALIWQLTKMISADSDSASDPNPFKWNSIMRFLGFAGAYDSNSGIIHKNEKQQGVFFSKDAIEVIKTMPNKFKKRDVRKKQREKGIYK